MNKLMWNRWPVAAALALIVAMPAGNVAYAQSAPIIDAGQRRLVIRDSALAVANHNRAQTAKPCKRGRRALIGGVIGGVASYPLANLAYRRFDNEAATDTGKAFATLIIGGSAAAGALIGWNSCRRDGITSVLAADTRATHENATPRPV